jgi:hypothetical protein
LRLYFRVWVTTPKSSAFEKHQENSVIHISRKLFSFDQPEILIDVGAPKTIERSIRDEAITNRIWILNMEALERHPTVAKENGSIHSQIWGDLSIFYWDFILFTTPIESWQTKNTLPKI